MIFNFFKKNSQNNIKPIDIVIGASRYKLFKNRLITQKYNNSIYKKINNELTEFIRLCPWESEALFNLVKFAKLGCVEIGRFNGGSAFLFCLSNPKLKIYSIDIAPQNDSKLSTLFKKFNCGQNVELIIDDANNYVKIFRKKNYKFDFLFIDGDHSFEGCLSDIKNWYPLLEPGGLIVFHDTSPDTGPTGGVLKAILEYCKKETINFIVPPNLTKRTWENPYGSLCIGIKPKSLKGKVI